MSSLFASGSPDSDVRIWSLSRCECLHTLTAHEGVVTRVHFCGNDRLLTASRDGTIRVWDVSCGEEVSVLRGHNDWVRDVVVSRDRTCAASCGGKTVKVREFSVRILLSKKSSSLA